ncbi:hypothetical protein WJX72_008605 [[Myrmecia] bisecta]|uniref:Ribonucleotide reductase large subunit C-terminal domain-containing protein n=1 Tax=[Myrmecia] bisecta TaxID=41462 RepID=A0AAW1PKK5_9CHLO
MQQCLAPACAGGCIVPLRPRSLWPGCQVVTGALRRDGRWQDQPVARSGRRQLCCQAAKGFGSGATRRSKGRGGSKSKLDASWVPVARLDELTEEKPTKPIILKDGTAIMLYQVDDEIYCSDANSTAFQFPLANAKIVQRKSGPAIEVALDGTIYDLATGEVIVWCPKNTLVRRVLGTLKEKDSPRKLQVYPTKTDDETIYDLEGIPEPLRALYKTVWELKQRVLVDMAADRGAFTDQSQSFNVHMSDPNFGKLTSLHFYAWKAGLKTGMYYLRTRAAADTIKFTVDQQTLAKNKAQRSAKTPSAQLKENTDLGNMTPPVIKAAAKAVDADMERERKLAALVCSLENKDECLMCGS